jgi:2-methylisocitrate lyase-like PEP mutase family enzyme
VDTNLPLKQRLALKPILLAPGVHDALTALLATQAGAECLYLSGAAIAYTRLGRPDIGLVSMSEVVETIALVRDRVPTPLIVDADNGYGNALNVQRTVRLFERAGASALQLEDQAFPKRCGHLAEKKLISAVEMVGKIRAAVDARDSTDTLIIARTDAIAVEGFQAAIDRSHRYAEAGADVLFVEAPGSKTALTSVCVSLGGRLPLMANMVEGGITPISSAHELEAIGYSLVIFPGGIVRATARAAQDFYKTLRRDGTTDALRDRMFDFDALNNIIGTPDLLAHGKSYAGDDA